MDVMTQEKKWTDHRLDGLARKVADGAARADKPLDDFRGEVNARFEKVEGKIEGGIKELRGEMGERFDKVDARFEKVDKKFDWLMGILLVSVLSILAAVAGPNFL